MSTAQAVQEASTVRLDPEAIELLALRISELLAENLGVRPSTSRAGRMLSAAEVSEWWGLRRGWVYQHADELGAVRVGDGERPRLRFDPERVAERLDRPSPAPPKGEHPRRRVRRSPRIRPDAPRLAFRADPELSSLKGNR